MIFSAAVLAGGRSTRMGSDKAFLRIGDELLIERQLRILRESGAEELLISGRPGVDYSAFPARVVFDDHPDAGPLAGVAAVLEASTHPLTLILAVDLPEMKVALLSKVLERSSTECGCVPLSEDGFQPLAAAYPKRALELAKRELQAGNYSMRAFVQLAVAEGLVSPLRLDTRDSAHFVNWNRPEDWREASR